MKRLIVLLCLCASVAGAAGEGTIILDSNHVQKLPGAIYLTNAFVVAGGTTSAIGAGGSAWNGGVVTGNETVSNLAGSVTAISTSKQESVTLLATNNGAYLKATLVDTYSTTYWTDPNVGWLKARIDMEGTNATQTLDSQGANHATLVASPVRVALSNQYGRVEHNYTLNGSTRYFTMTNSTALSPEAGNQTVSVWVNMTSRASAGNWSWIYNDYGNATANHVNMYVDSAGILTGDYRDSGNHDASATGGTIPTNQWIHLAMTRAGTVVSTYTNGVLVVSATNASLATISVSDGGVPFIGSFDAVPTAAYMLKGSVDDVRVYSSNLTASAILTLAQNTSPTNNIETRSGDAGVMTNSFAGINLGKVTVAGNGLTPILTYGDAQAVTKFAPLPFGPASLASGALYTNSAGAIGQVP